MIATIKITTETHRVQVDSWYRKVLEAALDTGSQWPLQWMYRGQPRWVNRETVQEAVRLYDLGLQLQGGQFPVEITPVMLNWADAVEFPVTSQDSGMLDEESEEAHEDAGG
jgi:hypothetical protein